MDIGAVFEVKAGFRIHPDPVADGPDADRRQALASHFRRHTPAEGERDRGRGRSNRRSANWTAYRGEQANYHRRGLFLGMVSRGYGRYGIPIFLSASARRHSSAPDPTPRSYGQGGRLRETGNH